MASERRVENRRIYSSRKRPEEVEGFQSVFLTPGGAMEVANISNGGVLIKTKERTRPGGEAHVRVVTDDATHEVEAKIVRSELATADDGICYLVALAFAEPLTLIDEDDVDVWPAATSEPEIPTALFPPDQAALDLRFARTPNRW